MKHNAQNLVIFCSFSFLLVSEREKFAIFALSSIQRLAWEHEERKVKTMEKHFCLDDSPKHDSCDSRVPECWKGSCHE